MADPQHVIVTTGTALPSPAADALAAVATSVPTVDLFGGSAALPDSVGVQIVTAVHGIRQF